MQVACVFPVRSGEVLIGKRSADRASYPGVWDVVGGHVEEGESLEAAARRELREELGIEIEIADLVLVDTVQLPEVELTVFATTTWLGEPRNVATDEHEALGWFTPADIAQLEISDARLPDLAAEAIARAARLQA